MPTKSWKKHLKSCLFMAVGRFFFRRCSPKCTKQSRTSFPFYRFFYTTISCRISAYYETGFIEREMHKTSFVPVFLLSKAYITSKIWIGQPLTILWRRIFMKSSAINHFWCSRLPRISHHIQRISAIGNFWPLHSAYQIEDKRKKAPEPKMSPTGEKISPDKAFLKITKTH